MAHLAAVDGATLAALRAERRPSARDYLASDESMEELTAASKVPDGDLTELLLG
jgi:hypothetical protein